MPLLDLGKRGDMPKQRRDILSDFDYVSLNDLADEEDGRFKLTSLLTKRVRELVKLRLLDESRGLHPVDVTIKEAKDGRISLEPAEEKGEDEGDTAA